MADFYAVGEGLHKFVRVKGEALEAAQDYLAFFGGDGLYAACAARPLILTA